MKCILYLEMLYKVVPSTARQTTGSTAETMPGYTTYHWKTAVRFYWLQIDRIVIAAVVHRRSLKTHLHFSDLLSIQMNVLSHLIAYPIIGSMSLATALRRQLVELN